MCEIKCLVSKKNKKLLQDLNSLGGKVKFSTSYCLLDWTNRGVSNQYGNNRTYMARLKMIFFSFQFSVFFFTFSITSKYEFYSNNNNNKKIKAIKAIKNTFFTRNFANSMSPFQLRTGLAKDWITQMKGVTEVAEPKHCRVSASSERRGPA